MCQIIPASILRNIVEHAHQPSTKERALKTLGDMLAFNQRRESGVFEDIFDAVLGREGQGLYREIYDAENTNEQLLTLVVEEGGKVPDDQSVKDAYNHSGAVYNFMKEKFGRSSFDDKDKKLLSTVHFGRGYSNAFFDGNSMTYGDGDGVIFKSFTTDADVSAHEIFHGVVQHSANLRYYKQSGALNEHFADFAGALVKQWLQNETAEQSNWLIGENLFGPTVDAVALRSMKNPGSAWDDEIIGSDPQVGHMDDYRDIEEDLGGVHLFSGIPNKAFYLASVNVGGFAWEKTGQVWYKALTTKLKSNSQFQDAANLITQTASEMFGNNSTEHKAIKEAWAEVGLKPNN